MANHPSIRFKGGGRGPGDEKAAEKAKLQLGNKAEWFSLPNVTTVFVKHFLG